MIPVTLKRLAWLLLTFATFVSAQEGAAAGEAGGESLANWRWANFALLALGLGYLIAKTFPPLFKSRNEEIQKGIAEAQKIRQDAEQRAAAVEAKTRSLSADIDRLRAESKAEMQQEGERIRQDTAAQIARLQQKADEEIDAAGQAPRPARRAAGPQRRWLDRRAGPHRPHRAHQIGRAHI